MCMNPGPKPPKVELEPITAISGKGITNEDPRFKANKMRKKRMNLRIKKPS